MGERFLRVPSGVYHQPDHHLFQPGERLRQVNDIANVGQCHDQLYGLCDHAAISCAFSGYRTSRLDRLCGLFYERVPALPLCAASLGVIQKMLMNVI